MRYLLLALFIVACGKPDDVFEPIVEPNPVVVEPVVAKPTIEFVSADDLFDTFTNYELIDEAIDYAYELGIEEVMQDIDNVKFYRISEGAWYLSSSQKWQKVDGADRYGIIHCQDVAISHELESGNYIFLSDDVDAWTVIHEMAHHYRHTNPEINSLFGYMDTTTCPVDFVAGEFTGELPEDWRMFGFETFEYAIGHMVLLDGKNLGDSVKDWFIEQFKL